MYCGGASPVAKCARGRVAERRSPISNDPGATPIKGDLVRDGSDNVPTKKIVPLLPNGVRDSLIKGGEPTVSEYYYTRRVRAIYDRIHGKVGQDGKPTGGLLDDGNKLETAAPDRSEQGLALLVLHVMLNLRAAWLVERGRMRLIKSALFAVLVSLHRTRGDAAARRRRAKAPAKTAPRSRRRRSRRPPPMVSAEHKKALAEKFGGFKFGMTKDEVLGVLQKQIDERYEDKIKATTDIARAGSLPQGQEGASSRAIVADATSRSTRRPRRGTSRSSRASSRTTRTSR